jgi:hypothetical protein
MSWRSSRRSNGQAWRLRNAYSKCDFAARSIEATPIANNAPVPERIDSGPNVEVAWNESRITIRYRPK